MNRLRELRESKKLKQKDIAALIKKTVQAYSLYELDKRNIDTDTLKKLSEFYKVSVDYILGSEHSKKSFDLQMFSNSKTAAFIAGQILSSKDDKKITLTLEALESISEMSVEQLEALNNFLKSVK